MRDAGIQNVLALRGDPPPGETEWTATEGGLEYSRELIELIRDDYDFAIGAACFPEVHIHAESAESDLRYCKEKVDAGARFLITQLFFDNALYWEFVARARDIGIDVPIIPGIMPITNFEQIKRFTSMCGATIPDRAAARARPARRPAGRGGRLRRRLRDAPVRRPAGQGRAGHPLLHAQPLHRHARDPQRAALHGAVAGRRARLGTAPHRSDHITCEQRADEAAVGQARSPPTGLAAHGSSLAHARRDDRLHPGGRASAPSLSRRTSTPRDMSNR